MPPPSSLTTQKSRNGARFIHRSFTANPAFASLSSTTHSSPSSLSFNRSLPLREGMSRPAPIYGDVLEAWTVDCSSTNIQSPHDEARNRCDASRYVIDDAGDA